MGKVQYRLLLAAGLMAAAGPLAGQATRTWVSGVGDDANPCSRTAPCKTFAGAIAKTLAHGEINALDPGGFGAVTITKSITIDGGAGQIAGVLVSGTNGIAVAAGSGDTVTLRNLDINGLATSSVDGIQMVSGANLVIQNCNIYGFSTRAISIETNTTGAKVVISDSIIHDNQHNGIVMTPSASGTNVVIERVQVVNNTATGIVIANGTAQVNNSSSSNNGVGIDVHGTSAADIVSTSLSNNQTGIQTYNSPIARLSNVSILDNTVDGYDNTGGTLYTFGNNQIAGNPINVGVLTPAGLQ